MAHHLREIVTVDHFNKLVFECITHIPSGTVVDVPFVKRLFIERFEGLWWGIEKTTDEEIYQALVELTPDRLAPEKISHFKVR